MASEVFCGVPPEKYHGIPSIFEYINQDGKHQQRNCGQAATATFLQYHGRIGDALVMAHKAMEIVESAFPPDIFFGLFGTSRRQVERSCKQYGLELQEILGKDSLRAALSAQQPVMVMLGVSGGKFWRWNLPSGHWMVAYGYDEDNVYLTNWGYMTWTEFENGWNKMIPRIINMRNKGLVVKNTKP